MKLKLNTVYRAGLFVLTASLTLGAGVVCKEKDKVDEKGGVVDKIWFRTMTDRNYAVLKTRDDKTQFEFSGRKTILKGKPTKTGKRKYEMAENVEDRKSIPKEDFFLVTKVIKNEKGFKIRDKDAKLLWKVNFYEDSIKISNNNDNRDSMSLKMIGDEVKIWDVTTLLGRSKFEKSSNKIRVYNASGKEFYYGKFRNNTFMYGVMMLDKIPEIQRFIIISEIFVRGR